MGTAACVLEQGQKNARRGIARARRGMCMARCGHGHAPHAARRARRQRGPGTDIALVTARARPTARHWHDGHSKAMTMFNEVMAGGVARARHQTTGTAGARRGIGTAQHGVRRGVGWGF